LRASGFTTDVYDGVLLIDSLNRTTLPVKDYPFAIGDRLLSVDGRDVDLLLQDFSVYAVRSNPISNKRLTAARITIRPQSAMPHAADVIGTSAKVAILRQSGATETYIIPWTVDRHSAHGRTSAISKAVSSATSGRAVFPATPDYMTELLNAQWSGVLNPEDLGLNGYGSLAPVFVNALANARFTRRLGGVSSDFFYSGTFTYDDLTIGYIRIPNYSPTSTAAALTQFEKRSPSSTPVPMA